MCDIVLIHTCDIICVDLLPLRILLKAYILININIQSFQRVLNSLTMKFTSKNSIGVENLASPVAPCTDHDLFKGDGTKSSVFQ